MREKRASLTRENMTSTTAKRKEWEGLKACGENKTNAEVFYRGFQNKIIQPARTGYHEGRKKKHGTRSRSSMSRTSISHAKYGHGDRMKHNK